ncbi:30S ribosomal protein S7 [Stieleria sp. JC731]|uniref:30S ribosomal protein S7 n=1 Tax=Pirellulaceae TaxID=2691357 RepID=UPI001E63EEB3|nr:30S ribosomal protein S7 [Stieleria sp. JC731]MCC9600033.1 30S ribosomal protein S7 [Stieleria sp. JC731]
MGRITASKKQMKGDPRHGSLLASKFINCLMLDGKKTVAQKVFYDALEDLSKRDGTDGQEPIEIFEQAIENIKPYIEVRSKRVGGASYQVPMQVNRARQQSLAIRWVLEAVRSKKGRPMHLKLADELMAGFKKEGVAYTKRENTHRMAEANKAFSHFAW